MKNKMNNLYYNYFYNVIYEILLVILPLITTPYLARVLGAKNIGSYTYTLSVITYFILLGSLGIAKYGQREIAYLGNDKRARTKLFLEILLLRFVTMGICGIIFYMTFASHSDYQIYYRILLLEIFSTCIDITWFFQGLEEFKKTISRNIIVKITSVFLIFIFVKNGGDLDKYIWIYVLSNLLGNLSLWLYLPKYLTSIKVQALQFFGHLRPIIILFIPQIAIKIYTVLDKTMLGSILNNVSEVAYYDEAQKLVKTLLAIIMALSTVMAPRIAVYYKNKQYSTMKVFMDKAIRYVYFLAIPMMIILFFIAPTFVPIFFGKGYQPVIPLIYLMCPIILFIGLSNIIGIGYLLPTKREKFLTISVTVGALVNMFLNLLLIPLLMSMGAFIATLIAELVVTIIQLYYIKDMFTLSEIFKKSKNNCIAGLMIIFYNCMIICVVPNTMIQMCCIIAGSIVIYNAILYYLKDTFFYNQILSLGSKLHLN